MIKSREQAIEAAKAMVSSKFDISSQAMGMMRGGSGNIYEAKASKDEKTTLSNLVESIVEWIVRQNQFPLY